MSADHKLSKNFFLISFLPAMAYWYLEENYPLKIALSGGLFLAIIEISAEKIFTKKVHTLSLFNFLLIALLGGISLIGDDGIWFKLQPFFSGIGISLFLVYQLIYREGMLYSMMVSLKPKEMLPPKEVIMGMEWHMALLFFFYSCFMAWVAYYLPTDRWLFFKTVGFYIVFGIFTVFEMIYVRFKIRKLVEFQQKAELMKRF